MTQPGSDLSLEELSAIAPAPQQGVALRSQEDNFLMKLIESRKLPGHVTTVAEAFTIGKMGKELGFPIMQAFHNIIPIQNKLTLTAKAQNALMRKGKISMQCTEDGVYVYKDGTTGKYPRMLNYEDGPTPTSPKVCLNPEDKPIDRRTTIIFTRDGIAEAVEFTWIDATKQGLVDKSNWVKMPKEMLYARCVAKGANRIATDLTMGLYTADELADAFDVPENNIRRDEEGTITEIITPHEEVTTATT